MSVASIQLSESLQALIDTRLDTIDRILLGRLTRQDRLAVVREVESQIYESLHQRGSAEFDRDDILAVLARLDPPEAYLRDEEENGSEFATYPASGQPARPARPSNPRVGTASGVIGICSLLGLFLSLPLAFVLAEWHRSDFPALFGGAATLFLAFVGGVLSFILGCRSRSSGSWAVVGMVISAIVVPTSLYLALIIDDIVRKF